MAAPTLTVFLERFPELGIHPVPVLEHALELGAIICPDAEWGDIAEAGAGYYAAHLVDLRHREIGAMVGQPVTGISGGNSQEGSSATFYGQQYEALRKTLPTTGFVF
jgi:hypothetical protein